MKVVIIGDVHGMTKVYNRILAEKWDGRETIQIGDMGIGFRYLEPRPTNHRFFRGNHDDPALCKKHPNYLGDYGYIKEHGIFYVAGAWSIDWQMRIPGQSWWEDEELSIKELNAAVDLYAATKPRFVLSHEAPSQAARHLLKDLMGDYFFAKAECSHSRTAQALQSMFELHRPEKWIFGHYHVDKTFKINGTEFRCVGELSQYELDTKLPRNQSRKVGSDSRSRA